MWRLIPLLFAVAVGFAVVQAYQPGDNLERLITQTVTR